LRRGLVLFPPFNSVRFRRAVTELGYSFLFYKFIARLRRCRSATVWEFVWHGLLCDIRCRWSFGYTGRLSKQITESGWVATKSPMGRHGALAVWSGPAEMQFGGGGGESNPRPQALYRPVYILAMGPLILPRPAGPAGWVRRESTLDLAPMQMDLHGASSCI